MNRIITVPAFSDNYIWLICDESQQYAAIVDPGDATPVIEALEKDSIQPEAILITHFHADHVGGIARLAGEPVMVIGQEKGRSVKDKVSRNFGMPKPEGYRKALRLMEMAERFQIPVITLIDTPGAYPGIDSEERGISEAIAQNLAVMSRLATPVSAL